VNVYFDSSKRLFLHSNNIATFLNYDATDGTSTETDVILDENDPLSTSSASRRLTSMDAVVGFTGESSTRMDRIIPSPDRCFASGACLYTHEEMLTLFAQHSETSGRRLASTSTNNVALTGDDKALTKVPMTACTVESASKTTADSKSDACQTNKVLAGLNSNIIDELKVMGYTFTKLDSNWVTCTGTTKNEGCFLQTSAANQLTAAAKSQQKKIPITSAFRTSAQQYLLFSWYNNGGKCGQAYIADAPGRSTHQSGTGIDVQKPRANLEYWAPILAQKDFKWLDPKDEVHFTYQRATDVSTLEITAFERVWNKYNPSDRIEVTGKPLYLYDEKTKKYSENNVATLKRLKASPCGGWGAPGPSYVDWAYA
jgi:LAS superfamily LD-carboxypeptidase LdcB